MKPSRLVPAAVVKVNLGDYKYFQHIENRTKACALSDYLSMPAKV